MPLDADQSLTSEAEQLCTSCVAPNPPTANFCAKCGAPLSSYSTIAPFESIFAEGFIYRKASEQPRSLVTVLGVWFLFGMTALGGFSFIALSFGDRVLNNAPDWKGGIAGGVFGMPVILFSLIMIWKTTRNYLHRKPVVSPGDV